MFPILEGLVAVVFLVQGFAKLFDSPGVSSLFAQDGIPPWLRYIVGLVEVAFALLLLNPRPRFLASFVMRKRDNAGLQPRDFGDKNERVAKGDLSHVF